MTYPYPRSLLESCMTLRIKHSYEEHTWAQRIKFEIKTVTGGQRLHIATQERKMRYRNWNCRVCHMWKCEFDRPSRPTGVNLGIKHKSCSLLFFIWSSLRYTWSSKLSKFWLFMDKTSPVHEIEQRVLIVSLLWGTETVQFPRCFFFLEIWHDIRWQCRRALSSEIKHITRIIYYIFVIMRHTCNLFWNAVSRIFIYNIYKKAPCICYFKGPGTALIETKPIQVYTNENHS